MRYRELADHGHAKDTVVFALSWLLRYIPLKKGKLLDGKAGLASLVFLKVKHNNSNKCFDSFSFVSYIDTIWAEYALGE